MRPANYPPPGISSAQSGAHCRSQDRVRAEELPRLAAHISFGDLDWSAWWRAPSPSGGISD